MEAKITDTYEGLVELGADWNDLLKICPGNLLYLTHEWHHVWWRHFGKGNELFIISVWDEGRLMAIAPLMIKVFRVGMAPLYRRLQFIAHEVSDYMDFIVRERREECFDLIFDQIARHGGRWEWAELVYIPENSPNFDQWMDASKKLKSLKKVFEKTDTAIAIHMYDGANNYNELEKVIPSRNRIGRVLKNQYSKILREERGVALSRTRDPAAIEEEFGRFVAYHKKRWKEKGAASQFEAPEVAAYYLDLARELARKGWFEMASIRSDNGYIAMAFGYIYNNRYYYYAPAFNSDYARYSPSQLLIRFLLESFYADKAVSVFDLLRGDESEKHKWSDKKLNLFRFLVCPYRMTSIISRNCDLAARLIAPKIKKLDRISKRVIEKVLR